MAVPGLIQRVANIVDTFLGGKSETGTDRLAAPVPPKAAVNADGTPPRAQVMDMSANLRTAPRQGSTIQLTAFDVLRALSDFDLCRICIEDVKGQVLGMDWEVGVKQEFKEQQDSLQPKVEEARAWVMMPDPLAGLDFKSWLSPVLEEVLVTDALSLYPRYDRAGRPIGLEQADGATILPLVDERGRPNLDGPAYHQVISGRAETAFTIDELWYLPRHRRVNQPYGRSPVENVLTTVNVAIRAHQSDLSYYTHGTLPDALWATPKEWTPQQVSDFQKLFDQMLEGNLERRAGRLHMVPGGDGAGLHSIKDRKWAYEYLEWLARVICWSFGVSPMPVAKIMNRATAEMQELSSLESGVKPVAQHVARVMTRFIQLVMELPEVEFRWKQDETEDESVTITRQKEMLASGAMEIDEVRKEMGLDPVMGGALKELGPLISTPAGPVFLADILKSREASEAQDAASIDPSLIQRAFLEVPVLRRDELRASVGLPAVGGEEGEEFVTIQSDAVKPLETPSGGGDTPPQLKPFTGEEPPPDDGEPPGEPGDEPPGDGGDGPPAPPGDEEDEDEEGEGSSPGGPPASKTVGNPPQPTPAATWAAAFSSYRAALQTDLSKLKKKGSNAKHLGGPPGLAFKTTCIPAWVMGGRWTDVNGLLSHCRKAELDLPDSAVAIQDKLEAWAMKWLASIKESVKSWAMSQVAEQVTASGEGVTEKVVPASAGCVLDLTKQDGFPDVSVSTALVEELQGLIEDAAGLGAADAAGAVGVVLGEVPEAAAVFAGERAAELVGMKLVDGALVVNPNPQWSISETLRQDIQNKVTQAVEAGWSPDKLAAELDSTLGSARAQTIARTETAFAYSEGAAEGYEDSGVELVEILDGKGCLPTGHDSDAPLPDKSKHGVVQHGFQANGQVWTVAQYRAHRIGHPNCVRAAVPFFQ